MFAQPVTNCRKLSLRLLRADARFQTRHQPQKVCSPFGATLIGVEIQWRDHINLRVGNDRPARQNADYRVAVAIQNLSRANDAWIASKASLPHAVTQHDNASAVGLLVIGHEDPTRGRDGTEVLKRAS